MDKLLTLGIDPWSMVLYLTTTGVLLVVLTYYLYRPILKFIDERRDQIQSSIDEAQNLQAKFTQKMEESQAEKEKMEAKLREEIKNLKTFVEKKRTEMVAEMEAEYTKKMQKAEAQIEARKANLIKESEKAVMALITKIVLDIVQNKVPEKVIQESVNDAWKRYNQS